MNPFDRLDQVAAPSPVGPPYNLPPRGSPPRPRDRSPFWAIITASNPPAYSWEEVEWSAPGTWAVKNGGRTSAECGPAYEANTFDFTEAGINPVNQIILLHELRTGEAAEYRFHYGPMADTELDSTWATITDNADAPVYVFDGDSGWGGEAMEVNGVLGIAEGTRVRVFRAVDEGEDTYAFEYSAAFPALELPLPIEVWPALVKTASASPLSAWIWIPGSGFPPAPWVPGGPPVVSGDHYELTPFAAPADVTYDQVGDGTFTDGTLLPGLKDYSDEEGEEIEDWIQIRCEAATILPEDGAVPLPPNGVLVTFFGTLAQTPLPYLVYVEVLYPGRSIRLVSLAFPTDAADDFMVTLVGAGGTGHYHVRTKAWTITLDNPPPTGATIQVFYSAAEDATWSWVQMPHTVELEFWAKITGHTMSGSSGSYSSTYEFEEVEKTGAGYGNWTPVSGGRSGTAYNGDESLRNYYQDRQLGAIVRMYRVQFDSTVEYWFNGFYVS